MFTWHVPLGLSSLMKGRGEKSKKEAGRIKSSNTTKNTILFGSRTYP